MMMTYSPLYERKPITSWDEIPQANMAQRWIFVGIDLAPNASLESGIAILDRDLTLLRMDKLYNDEAILDVLTQLGAAHTLVVSLDMPKNLAIPGRFRQEEIKYNAMRLDNPEYDRPVVDRFSDRAYLLYKKISDLGILPFLTYTPNTKASFKFFFPYKSRSPQGCRALQGLIQEELKVKNVPTNLAPSSVLEALLAAYSAWSTFGGTLNKEFEIKQNHHGLNVLVSKTPVVYDNTSPIRPAWMPA
ncbi:MAG: hypothetical protein ACK551_06445 [Vampirovibrionales bacterium]